MITTAHPTTVETVEDVEELDALALNRTLPLERLLVVDRFDNPLTVYPDLRRERVTIVRQPLLGEAVQVTEGVRTEVVEEWTPLVFASDLLEQWRFPMRVIAVRPAAYIPTDLETDLAA